MHIKENFLHAHLIFCKFVSVLKISILFSIPSRKFSYTPYCRKFSARLQNFLGVSVNGCQFSANNLLPCKQSFFQFPQEYLAVGSTAENFLQCYKIFWNF